MRINKIITNLARFVAFQGELPVKNKFNPLVAAELVEAHRPVSGGSDRQLESYRVFTHGSAIHLSSLWQAGEGLRLTLQRRDLAPDATASDIFTLDWDRLDNIQTLELLEPVKQMFSAVKSSYMDSSSVRWGLHLKMAPTFDRVKTFTLTHLRAEVQVGGLELGPCGVDEFNRQFNTGLPPERVALRMLCDGMLYDSLTKLEDEGAHSPERLSIMTAVLLRLYLLG